MKRIACVAVLAIALVGCSASFKSLSTEDKVSVVGDKVAYYGRYVTGVRFALPYLSSYFPAAQGLITGVLCPLLEDADAVLVAYQEGRAKAGDVQNAISRINEVVGDIKGGEACS